jgi:cyclic pyranopterin phosphate synthase
MVDLTHFDEEGGGRMVDVGPKSVTRRYAKASGAIRMMPETLDTIRDATVEKGDVLGVARLAGIMAAKRTSELIPLCHSLSLDGIELKFDLSDNDRVRVAAEVRVDAKTGVEMEALVAVSTSLLTIYDMCKSVDRGMVIENIQLDEKSGGKSGHYLRS